jgi:hypothetical protein
MHTHAAQFINPDDKYDFMRTLRLGSFGALVHGPTGHFFYGMLDRKLPGTSPTTVATKVAIDQVCCSILPHITQLFCISYYKIM